MTKEERIAAEKSLARFGDSIQIKDYGLALQIMHNQIVFAQKEASKIFSNGMLAVTSDSEKNKKESGVAVAFAEWIDGCMYSRMADEQKYLGWTDGNEKIANTTEELFEIYEKHKSAKATDGKNF